MIPKVLIEEAPTPKGGKNMSLYQHDQDYIIIAGSQELMNSRAHFSEEELGRLSMERIQDQPNPHVLIGGLGMGFTLKAALDALPQQSKVVVAELVPAVVKWNQQILGKLAGHPLEDRRVFVKQTDVTDLIKVASYDYYGIILDIDNGPSGLAVKSNDWLYGFDGLKAIKGALQMEGVLAIWSAYADKHLTHRLKGVGFKVDEIPVRARPGNKGAHHHIWIATKRNP